MEAFESSITFHHILSQPFSNNDKYGNFLKVLLFPSGSFHSMGMKQGLIVSRGNIPKDSVCVYLFCIRLMTNLAMQTPEASTCGVARLVTLGTFQTEHIGV